MKFILFAGIGKIFLYMVQLFVSDNIRGKYKLFSCDLCLGTWLYTFLSIMLGVDLIDSVSEKKSIFHNFLTGISTSFLVHLVSEGWKSKFTEYIIE